MYDNASHFKYNVNYGMATQNEKSQAPSMFGDILRGMRRMTDLAIAHTQVVLLQTQIRMGTSGWKAR